MATYTSQTTLRQGFVLKLTLTQSGSNCNAKLQLIIDSGASMSASYVSYALSGDTTASGGGSSASYGSGTHTLINKDFTKSGSVSVTGNLYVPAYGWNANVTASGGQSKPTITKCSITPRSEKSVLVDWSADATIAEVQYQYKPSGGSWNTVTRNIADNDHGYFRITDLQINKKYYFNLKVKRKSDSVWSNWSEQQVVTTYNTPTISSITNVYETSMRVNWQCDSDIKSIKYSLDGGDNYSSAISTSGTSGYINITELSPNPDTPYQIKLSLNRNTDPEQDVWSNTATTSQGTYQYPYVSSVRDINFKITDGVNDQNIYLYNPIPRNVTLYMKKDSTSGTTLFSETTSDTSDTISLSENTLLDSLPNSSRGDCVYYCVYDGHIVQTIDGTYYLEENNRTKPSFSDTNWSYATDYSVNNQVAIKNKSNITVSVNTAGTPYRGTTMKEYRVKWGNVTEQVITDITDLVILQKGSSDTLTVTAKDNRDFTRETTKTIEVINYEDQTCTITAKRTNGVGTDVKLSLNGSYQQCQLYTDSTTKADNTILSVKYYIKSGNSWGTGYTIPLNQLTIGSGSFSLNNYQIYSDGASAGFTIGTRYNLKVEIQDRYQTKPFEYVITDGKIAVDCYQDSNGDYHRGVNGLAENGYVQTLYGHEFVKGNMLIRGLLSIDNASDGDHTMYIGNTSYNKTNQVITKNGSKEVGIGVDDGRDFRIWDYTNSKEILRSKTGGYNTFNGSLKYQHTNEINFSGGTQSQCIFNWRNADTDGYDSSATCEYWFCNYNGRDVSKSTLVAGNATISRSGKIDIGSGGLKGHSSNNDAFLWSNGGWVYIRPKGEDTADAQMIVKNNGQIWSYNQGARVYGATVLYNNDSGTDGNFSLSDNAGNYDYLVFFYKNNDGNFGSTMIYDAYSKVIVLNANHNNDNYAYIKGRSYKIWNTAINVQTSGYQARVGNGVATTFTTSSAIYVTRVIGYK